MSLCPEAEVMNLSFGEEGSGCKLCLCPGKPETLEKNKRVLSALCCFLQLEKVLRCNSSGRILS